ncbi:hypothetical protein B0A48_06382 [Cryoendolithus antarcticus]|uniref:feruloyl esterase n=1 Tax=Cryoendolithus antarcticus TaxID=1507870 RepID=A0A1V8TBF0_9PEZI|nr:hypothetical protein B0A48_06382 [Cryoendolithus antarcticus]
MVIMRHLSALLSAAGLYSTLTVANSTQGCGKALAPGITTGGTGSSNEVNFTTTKGDPRTFLLHIPTTYTPDERRSKLSEADFNPEMPVVYPDDINNYLGKQYCLDNDRVYVTGMSNGGSFAARILACDSTASKKIAAVAGVSGAYYQGTTEDDCKPATVPIPCNGRTPFPVLEFHGTNDGVIPYAGGPRRHRCLPDIPHFVIEWAVRNDLGTSNHSSSLYDGGVTKYTFGSGSSSGLTTHYKIEGVGHTWPSVGGNYSNINATPLIVKFFNKACFDGI